MLQKKLIFTQYSFFYQAPRVTSVRPRLGWPSHGNVILANYSTRYRPGLDLVLKHIDVNIRGGEKVGKEFVSEKSLYFEYVQE